VAGGLQFNVLSALLGQTARLFCILFVVGFCWTCVHIRRNSKVQDVFRYVHAQVKLHNFHSLSLCAVNNALEENTKLLNSRDG
jgi:hypothetical protein